VLCESIESLGAIMNEYDQCAFGRSVISFGLTFIKQKAMRSRAHG